MQLHYAKTIMDHGTPLCNPDKSPITYWTTTVWTEVTCKKCLKLRTAWDGRRKVNLAHWSLFKPRPITNAMKSAIIGRLIQTGTSTHARGETLGYILQHLVTEKIPFQLTWTPTGSFVRVTGGDK